MSIRPADKWTPTNWQADAQCARQPDLFFPPKGRKDIAKVAKAVCDKCPVAIDCLRYALSLPEDTTGIWGRTSRRQRRRLRAEMAQRKAS